MTCRACGRRTTRLTYSVTGRPLLRDSTRVIRFYSRSRAGIVSWNDVRFATLPIHGEVICHRCCRWSDWRDPEYGLTPVARP